MKAYLRWAQEEIDAAEWSFNRGDLRATEDRLDDCEEALGEARRRWEETSVEEQIALLPWAREIKDRHQALSKRVAA